MKNKTSVKKTKPRDWNLILEFGKTKPHKIPEGFKSAVQVAKEMKCSNSHARSKLSAAFRMGFVERRSFMVNIDGVCRVIPHYRLK